MQMGTLEVGITDPDGGGPRAILLDVAKISNDDSMVYHSMASQRISNVQSTMSGVGLIMPGLDGPRPRRFAVDLSDWVPRPSSRTGDPPPPRRRQLAWLPGCLGPARRRPAGHRQCRGASTSSRWCMTSGRIWPGQCCCHAGGHRAAERVSRAAALAAWRFGRAAHGPEVMVSRGFLPWRAVDAVRAHRKLVRDTAPGCCTLRPECGRRCPPTAGPPACEGRRLVRQPAGWP